MSTAWGLLPLGMDESDLMMFLLSIFILAVLVILMFLYLPLHIAVLGTLFIVCAIYYGVWELKRQENQSEQEKKEL
ncbi:MAG: hypothetical protein ACFFEV_09130 [Candidatus Thorarchaeota archaeon]